MDGLAGIVEFIKKTFDSLCWTVMQYFAFYM